jgi:hypothetical protein
MQRIFRAMKKYGLILADNGTDMYISGTYDTRWDNDVLNPAFAALKVSDFEVIERGWAPSVSLVLTFPSTVGAGDATTATVTAYDSSYNVATGYAGTIHFTATDGAATLPLDYTFIAGDAGAHTFAGGFTLQTPGSQVVTATDTVATTIAGSRGVVVGPPTPTGLLATAASAGQINLSWNPSAGATQYEIVRAAAPGGAYATLTTTASTSYPDIAVSAGSAYVYKVRALDSSSRPSPFSAPDAATAMLFTDSPLAATVTLIKAVHLSELRQAVNAMRATAVLGAASFTDLDLTGGMAIKAVHVQQLRDALTEARATLGLTAIAFTDPTLTPGPTAVKAVHVEQLRTGVK